MEQEYMLINGENTTLEYLSDGTWNCQARSGSLSSSYFYSQARSSFSLRISYEQIFGDQNLQGKRLFYYFGSKAPKTDVTIGSLSKLGWISVGTTSVLSFKVSEGRFFGIAISNIGGSFTTVSLVKGLQNRNPLTFPVSCVVGETLITLKDGSKKEIRLLERGEELKSNCESKRIARITVEYIENELLFKVNDDLICTQHPIVCNNGQNRVYPSKIKDIETAMFTGNVYNIQYEEEGYFHVGDLMLDSLSPWFHKDSLPEEMYFDQSKYISYTVYEEDDLIRDKPEMTENVENLLFE